MLHFFFIFCFHTENCLFSRPRIGYYVIVVMISAALLMLFDMQSERNININLAFWIELYSYHGQPTLWYIEMAPIHILWKLKITLNVPGILKSASLENVSHHILSLFSFNDLLSAQFWVEQFGVLHRLKENSIQFNPACRFSWQQPTDGFIPCPAAQSFLFSNKADGVSEVLRSQKNAICCVAIFYCRCNAVNCWNGWNKWKWGCIYFHEMYLKKKAPK